MKKSQKKSKIIIIKIQNIKRALNMFVMCVCKGISVVQLTQEIRELFFIFSVYMHLFNDVPTTHTPALCILWFRVTLIISSQHILCNLFFFDSTFSLGETNTRQPFGMTDGREEEGIDGCSRHCITISFIIMR